MTQNVTLCLQNGSSPVYVASENGHTDVVDLLVQAGADIHLADPEVYTLIRTVSSSAVIVVVRLTNVGLIECVSPLNELSPLLSLYTYSQSMAVFLWG